MDHLPRVGPHVDVPYEVQEHHAYDGLGLEFPLPTGERLAFSENFDRDMLSLIQARLYFGFVIEVLRVPGVVVMVEDFIRTTESRQSFITTSCLPSLLWLWALRVKKQDKDTKERDKCLILEILKSMQSEHEDLMRRAKTVVDEEQELLQRPLFAILLSIAILGETLTQCFEKQYDCGGPTWSHCWFLDEYLLRSGWCPYEITLLCRRSYLGNTGLYYLSSVRRERDGEDHTDCLRGICRSYTVDEEKYKTKHEVAECECEDLTGDTNIHQIILGGQIPLFTVTTSQDGSCEAHVEAFSFGQRPKSKTRYVAISHVWSHGIGNPRKNSLPRCQLSRLQNFCDRLYDQEHRPVPFWIDTVCVPLEPQHRKKAIELMVPTYKEADKVLVLDASLLRTSLEKEFQEPLLMILSSGWSQRLWTFQEGILSRSLHFQFQGKTFHRDDLRLRNNFFEGKRLTVQESLKKDLGGIREFSRRGHPIDISKDDWEWMNDKKSEWFWDVGMGYALAAFRTGISLLHDYNPARKIMKDYEKLPSLLTMIHWRSTSKAEDEASCIAALLGLDVKNLLSLEKDKKIAYILSSMRMVPVQILFFSGPRINKYGSRWIPTSFLGQGNPATVMYSEMVPVGPRGLYVRLSGYLLSIKDPGFPSTVSEIHLTLDDGSGIYDVHPWEEYDVENAQPEATEINWSTYFSREMAIVLIPLEEIADHPKPGALVSIMAREGDAIYARYELNVCITRRLRPLGAMARASTPNIVPNVHGTAVASSQKWCVG